MSASRPSSRPSPTRPRASAGPSRHRHEQQPAQGAPGRPAQGQIEHGEEKSQRAEHRQDACRGVQISGPDRGDQARGDGLGLAAIQPVEHSAREQHDALVMRSQRGCVDHRRVDQEEQRRRRTGADRDLLDDVAELPFLEIIEVCGSRLQAHDEVLAAAPAKEAAQPEPDEHSGEQGRKRGGRQPGQRLGQQRHVAQTVHSIQSVRESIEVGELRARRSHGSARCRQEPGNRPRRARRRASGGHPGPATRLA